MDERPNFIKRLGVGFNILKDKNSRSVFCRFPDLNSELRC